MQSNLIKYVGISFVAAALMLAPTAFAATKKAEHVHSHAPTQNNADLLDATLPTGNLSVGNSGDSTTSADADNSTTSPDNATPAPAATSSDTSPDTSNNATTSDTTTAASTSPDTASSTSDTSTISAPASDTDTTPPAPTPVTSAPTPAPATPAATPAPAKTTTASAKPASSNPISKIVHLLVPSSNTASSTASTTVAGVTTTPPPSAATGNIYAETKPSAEESQLLLALALALGVAGFMLVETEALEALLARLVRPQHRFEA